MSVIRSITRSVIRPVIRSVIKSDSASRFFTNFINSRSSYAAFTTPVTLDTAYRVIIDAEAKSTTNSTQTLIGQVASATTRFDIQAAGTLLWRVDGTNVTTTAMISRDDIIHEYAIELDGNDFIFTIDDVVFDTITNATAAAKTATIDGISISNSLRFYDGFITRLFLEENAVAKTLLEMDEPFSNPDFENSIDALNPATKFNILADQVVEMEV